MFGAQIMTAPLAGDYAVVRTGGWQAAVIRIVTRSHYNHAFIYVGDGQIVEAQPGGARLVQNSYDAAHVRYSTVTLSPGERVFIVNNAKRLVGVPYGWLDIVSVGLLQFHIRPFFLRERVRTSKNLICSQLVDFTFLLSGVHLLNDGRLPMDVTPGDLDHLIANSAS